MSQKKSRTSELSENENENAECSKLWDEKSPPLLRLNPFVILYTAIKCVHLRVASYLLGNHIIYLALFLHSTAFLFS